MFQRNSRPSPNPAPRAAAACPAWLSIASLVLIAAAGLATPGCGSHAAEDRKAMDEESKKGGTDAGAKNDDSAGKGTRNLIERERERERLRAAGPDGADQASIAKGACSAPLTLVTELEAGKVRTVLSGDIDATCASGLTPLISVTSEERITFPPMECVALEAGQNAMRCRADRAEVVIDGSRVVIPVVVSEGALAAEVVASVSFHSEDEVDAAFGRGDGPEIGNQGAKPRTLRAAGVVGPIRLE